MSDLSFGDFVLIPFKSEISLSELNVYVCRRCQTFLTHQMFYCLHLVILLSVQRDPRLQVISCAFSSRYVQPLDPKKAAMDVLVFFLPL